MSLKLGPVFFYILIILNLYAIPYNERGEPVESFEETQFAEEKDSKSQSAPGEVDLAQQNYEKAILLFKEGKRADAFSLLESILNTGKKDSPFLQRARYIYFLEKAKDRQNIPREMGEEVFATADGYALCAEEVENRKTCLNLEKNELFKAFDLLAKLRLSIRYYWDKNYELAYKLLFSLAQENLKKKEIPMDYVWYYLGRIYEEDPSRRDFLIAKACYQKVLEIPYSFLHDFAREALSRMSF